MIDRGMLGWGYGARSRSPDRMASWFLQENTLDPRWADDIDVSKVFSPRCSLTRLGVEPFAQIWSSTNALNSSPKFS
jgi:hypothetical protein